MRIAQNWEVAPAVERSRGHALCEIALDHGRFEPDALTTGGYALAFLTGDVAKGLQTIERAIELNPNSTLAYAFSGWLRCYLGDSDKAIADFRTAIRFDPLDPTLFRSQTGITFGHLLERRYAEAIEWGRKAVVGNPRYAPLLRALAAALALSGNRDEAASIVKILIDVAPGEGITKFRAWTMFRHAGHEKLAILLDGLRLAGVPE